MASPYSSVTISGYNSNPPSDDGSAVSTNQITWAGTKTKLADPIKTRTDSMDSALVTAFTKMLGGGGITSVSTNYTVQSSDQGKLIKATASLTLTMGDATAFLAPFCHGFVNLSGTTITVQGSGGQTIDGNASFTVAPQAGFLAFTDGSNWNTTGLQGTLIGSQLMYGDIINGTIVQSNVSNAVTYSLKTLAGNDPSSTDPVLVCFRNSTLGTGNYVYRAVTAATSVTISAGSTMGTSNNVPCRLWFMLFDDAGTVRMGAINCWSGTSIYPLGRIPRASSTAEGGLGAADSAQVIYSTVAVTSKSYVVMGFADYESGLSTAGNWNVNPDHIQLFGPGIPLPGQTLQRASATSSTQQTTASATYTASNLSLSFTATSAANVVYASASGIITGASNACAAQLGIGSGPTMFGSVAAHNSGTTTDLSTPLSGLVQAASTSAQTVAVYLKSNSGSVMTWLPGSGYQTVGSLLIDEIMA